MTYSVWSVISAFVSLIALSVALYATGTFISNPALMGEENKETPTISTAGFVSIFGVASAVTAALAFGLAIPSEQNALIGGSVALLIFVCAALVYAAEKTGTYEAAAHRDLNISLKMTKRELTTSKEAAATAQARVHALELELARKGAGIATLDTSKQGAQTA